MFRTGGTLPAKPRDHTACGKPVTPHDRRWCRRNSFPCSTSAPLAKLMPEAFAGPMAAFHADAQGAWLSRLNDAGLVATRRVAMGRAAQTEPAEPTPASDDLTSYGVNAVTRRAWLDQRRRGLGTSCGSLLPSPVAVLLSADAFASSAGSGCRGFGMSTSGGADPPITGLSRSSSQYTSVSSRDIPARRFLATERIKSKLESSPLNQPDFVAVTRH